MATRYFQTGFRTGDTAKAEARLQERYGRLGLLADDLQYREEAVGDSRFVVDSIDVEGGFSYALVSRGVTICTSTPGHAWETADESGESSEAPALFRPGQSVVGRAEGTHGRTVVLDPAALTRFARAMYADDDFEVRFSSAHPVNRSAAQSWRALLVAVQEVEQLLENDLVRASVFRSVAESALELFRLEGDPAERHASAASQRDVYRKAVAFLHDHASLPITLEDAAQHAGASTVQLADAFAVHSPMGYTPAQHLRRTRLSAAHLDLLEGDPAIGDTVRGIALRWGFPDPSRFARYHRRVYGTNPGEVLRA